MEMIDKEKVIHWFERCVNHDPNSCKSCPYQDCFGMLQKDVLTLLKAQEPILLENQHKPYGVSTNANSPWISRCPRCGKKVEGKQTKFCKYCGQAVRWE